MKAQDDSSRLLRAAHLIASRIASAPFSLPRAVDTYMRYTTHIAASFYLSEALHRRAAELAVAYGEAELARQICEQESTTSGGGQHP